MDRDKGGGRGRRGGDFCPFRWQTCTWQTENIMRVCVCLSVCMCLCRAFRQITDCACNLDFIYPNFCAQVPNEDNIFQMYLVLSEAAAADSLKPGPQCNPLGQPHTVKVYVYYKCLFLQLIGSDCYNKSLTILWKVNNREKTVFLCRCLISLIPV